LCKLKKKGGIFYMGQIINVHPNATDLFQECRLTHYNKLGIDIPEGLPACNPNDVSVSDNLISTITLF